MAASENPKGSNLKRDKGRDLKLVGTIMAGKYKVLKVLGQGGFGSVFLVEMTSGIIGSQLAMKILPPEFSQNKMLREQFMNEIRVAMKMVDAHIVQIRDVGITEGDPEKGGGLLYYTMDYVAGKTLAQLIKQEGSLSIWRTLRIARRLLPALKVAHGAGIIHRDLKPANIMIEVVGEKELPRILDFGIATAVITDTELESSLEGGLKDKEGFVGSPYYMPPEQFRGVEMGFYTDLYSLGVIIYECLTGQKPYTGKSPKEVYKKIKQGPPVAVDELQPAVGKVAGLTELVTKSLERNPEKRFQSAKEFFEALNNVMSGKSEEVVPVAAPPPVGVAQKPRIAARQRATGMRKTAMGSVLRDRMPRRRRSNLGAFVLLTLGLSAIGLLAFLFKDDLLEAIRKRREDQEAPSTTAKKTPGTGQPGPGPTEGQPGPAGQKTPESGKPPAGQQPPERNPQPDPAELIQINKVRLAERIRTHLQAAEKALNRKEWNTATGEADSVLELEAFHAGALLLKARVMLKTNQSIPAIVTLESALKTVNGKELRIEILRNLAIAHTSLQKPDWAIAATKLEEAVALDLKNGSTGRLLVRAYQQLKQEEQLAAFVRKAHEAGNKDRTITDLYNQIWILGPQKRQKELKEQTALALRKYSEEDYRAASRAAGKALSLKPGVEMAELVVDSLIWIEVGQGFRAGLAREARQALSRLYEIVENPSDIMELKILFYDAKISYLESGSGITRRRKSGLNEAELKLTRVLNQLDSRKPTKMYYEAVSWRGLVFASRSQLDNVVTEFKAARESKDPRLIDLHAGTYLVLGMYLKETDNKKKAYDLAKGRLLNLLKVSGLSNKRKADTYYKLGLCYLQVGKLTDDDGDLRKAANRFMDAKKNGYESPGLYESLGETYRHLGEFIKAAVYYRDAYYRAPSPSRCLMAISHFLESNPRAPQAKELLVHALQKFPDDERLLKKQLELE